MNRSLLTLAALLLTASTAVADRVVVFNSAEIWPEPRYMDMPGFGPMPLGYYILNKDDVEVEFEMDDEMENEHDAYYYRGKMNIYAVNQGIKMVSFTCRPTSLDATFTLLYQSNYNFTQGTLTGDENTTVFEFVDTYRDYVGLVGMADILAITVTLDEDVQSEVSEVADTHEIAQVRFFNAAGQEMSQPRGLTICVTTYTNGSTTVKKCMK